MIGKTISHYKILEKIGEGGMGVVYKAEDTKLKRTVALKFLPPEFSRVKEAKKRFMHEAQAAAAIEHPNICPVHEVNETQDGQMYIVMAYYEGETLKDKIASHPLPLAEAMDVAVQIASGLQRAHESNIIHRDIKTANIFTTDRNEIKILDFGLAKLRGQTRLTKESTTLGTIAYMSPEQTTGEAMDQRTDIWSLGVVFYEMLTGELPFKGHYEQAVIYSIMNEDPKSISELLPDAPASLEHIINKMLAKDPEKRYLNLSDFKEDLNRFKKGKELKEIPAQAKLKIKFTPKYMALGIFFLAAIIIAGYLIFRGKPGSKPSIAVLPLMNTSGDPDQQYFVVGMHHAMITELSKIGALRVISRSSALRYKNTNKPLSQISKELKVDYLVEGSVLKTGNQVRVTTQLIHAIRDENVWADSYDRPLEDILAFYSEVAQTIAREIRVTVTPEEKNRLDRTQKVDPETYRLYLKGNFQLYRFTEVSIRKAIGLFQDAIKKDPAYAPAYMGLSSAYLTLGGWHTSVRPTIELSTKAKKAAQKAIELDEQLAEAHMVLGRIKWLIDWDWSGADREFKRGLKLNPGSWTVLLYYANYLTGMGRFQESIELGKKALEIDPLSVATYNELGFAYRANGQDKKAFDQIFAGLELDPGFSQSHWGLAMHYAKKGLYEKALTQMDKLMSGNQVEMVDMPYMAFLYGKSGRKAEALKILNNLKLRAGEEYVSASNLALIYIGLGQKEEAMDWLDKAYQERDRSLVWLKIKWIYDPLRDESRFKDLLRRMNFPE